MMSLLVLVQSEQREGCLPRQALLGFPAGRAPADPSPTGRRRRRRRRGRAARDLEADLLGVGLEPLPQLLPLLLRHERGRPPPQHFGEPDSRNLGTEGM